MSDTTDLQEKYPPTIISFSDAMRLLKMARDAYAADNRESHGTHHFASICACAEIARVFEREGKQS